MGSHKDMHPGEGSEPAKCRVHPHCSEQLILSRQTHNLCQRSLMAKIVQRDLEPMRTSKANIELHGQLKESHKFGDRMKN